MQGELAEGTVLNGRYRIGGVLGRGGFGITYLARDEQLGQRVVVKEYFPAASAERNTNARDGKTVITEGTEMAVYREGRKRFLKEARILASLFEVPGIVKVYGYFQENETAYCVMEYVSGISLRKFLERNEEPMAFEAAWQLLHPVLQALESVHRKKLLHRDFNPDNLLVQEDGSLKLLDFGSARQFFYGRDAGRTMTVLVKDGYAPPEQYRRKGSQGPWTDIYAVCATLYEMVTGCIPPNARERQVRDGLYPPSAYGAEITPGQEEALMKGLSLEVRQRFRSLHELCAAIEPPPAEKMTRKKRRVLRWILGAGLAAAAAVTGWFMLQSEGAEETVYAGNYTRGSREYEAFLKFVRERAVSTEKGEKGTVYHLDDTAVREWNQPSNSYTLSATIDQFLAEVGKLGYEPEYHATKDMFTVTQLPYGVIQTSFGRRDEFWLRDGLRLTILYDLISSRIQNLYVYAAHGSGQDISGFAADAAFILSDDIDKTRAELIESYRETGNEYMEKTAGGSPDGVGMGYGYADCEIMLLRTPEGDLAYAFLKKGIDGASYLPPYYWP